MLKSLLGFLGGDDNAVNLVPTAESTPVAGPVRIASSEGAIELTLGKQRLRLYPEQRLAVDSGGGANAEPTDWILVDPERFFAGIAGFARLDRGKTLPIGRDNEALVKTFDFPKSVKRRHLALTNVDGSIVIRPLDGEGTTTVASVAEEESAEWFAARRVENLRRLRTRCFGGPIEMLGAR